MGYTYGVTGTLTITPPVPLATLWDLLDRPYPRFTVAPIGADRQQLEALAEAKAWLLVPAPEATPDAHGRPSHIGALMVDDDARSSTIDDALLAFANWCTPVSHHLTGALNFQGEGFERGVIQFTEDGALEWTET